MVDFHNCVLRTDDVEVLAWYGVSAPASEIAVCFSVPRAAVLGYRSDHDPQRENLQGSSGDCLGRNAGASWAGASDRSPTQRTEGRRSGPPRSRR